MIYYVLRQIIYYYQKISIENLQLNQANGSNNTYIHTYKLKNTKYIHTYIYANDSEYAVHMACAGMLQFKHLEPDAYKYNINESKNKTKNI